jgi:putative membrane protein
MMKKQFAQFLVRWSLNALGLFVAAGFLQGVTYQNDTRVLLITALILAIVNALAKPFLIILALPALILTLGIFSVVINGFIVYVTHLLYGPFEVDGFVTAVLAGMVVGLVNYIVTRVFDALVKE